MSRRYAYGDRVVIVIEGVVQSYDDAVNLVEVDYIGRHGGAVEAVLDLDAQGITAYPADEITTEYGVRYRTDSGGYMYDAQVADEPSQRETTNPELNPTLRAAGVKVSRLTRPVFPWSEISEDDQPQRVRDFEIDPEGGQS